jgi:hypothetical protein
LQLETQPCLCAYKVQLLKRGQTGLDVTSDLEIEGLRSQLDRVYASGTITLDWPYLAVDSFLGPQYSSLPALPLTQAFDSVVGKSLIYYFKVFYLLLGLVLLLFTWAQRRQPASERKLY